MHTIEPTLGAQAPTDSARDERREYVTPTIEPLGGWQAVALAESTRLFP